MVVAAAVTLVLGVASCGGGSGETQSTATTGTSPASAGAAGGGGEGRAKKQAAEEQGSRSSNAEVKEEESAAMAGTGPIASGGAAPFKTKGGDNSIQESGAESEAAELREAASVLHTYLDARAAEQWHRACDQVSAAVTESLSRLASSAAQQGGKSGKKLGCPQLIAALSAGMPPYLQRELTKAEVGALRVRGSGGFLLFHGAHGSDYFMPMAREAGKWKVAALAASELP